MDHAGGTRLGGHADALWADGHRICFSCHLFRDLFLVCVIHVQVYSLNAEHPKPTEDLTPTLTLNPKP